MEAAIMDRVWCDVVRKQSRVLTHPANLVKNSQKKRTTWSRLHNY